MAGWILVVEWLSRFVLLGLLGLSIWSVTIILERRKFFKSLNSLPQGPQVEDWIKRGDRIALMKWASEKSNTSSLHKNAVSVLLERPTPQSMELSFSHFMGKQREQLESGLGVLGTLGSTTPFVGLFGTILGIIVAFGALSTGQIDSQRVMYALAEALILTAVGLGVAIPSVVAFNYFNSKLAKIENDLIGLKDLIISHFAQQTSDSAQQTSDSAEQTSEKKKSQHAE